jgi:hypothetical protein
MACERCGYPTPRSRLCRDCGKDEHRDTGPVGGTASDDRDDTDEWDVQQRGLDGDRHTGQATLEGGVAKDAGGDE